MADSMNVTGNVGKIDLTKWKKLTAQEIIKEESRGEEIPAEIITWAQQMAAFSKIPDDVTYEQVDGDIGLDALDKLGIEPEEEQAMTPEGENAEVADTTEDPDAVKDPARTTESEETDDEAIPEQATFTKSPERTEEEVKETEELTLADSTLNTDAEKIRKRKERKGLA